MYGPCNLHMQWKCMFCALWQCGMLSYLTTLELQRLTNVFHNNTVITRSIPRYFEHKVLKHLPGCFD